MRVVSDGGGVTAPAFEFEEAESREVDTVALRHARSSDESIYACFPLRSEWEQTQPKEHSLHPAPEHVGEWGDVPAELRRLERVALAAGWQLQVRYARGTPPRGALRHSLAVRIRRPGRAGGAVAVYVKPVVGAGGWTWESVWILPQLWPVGFTSLKEWLERGGEVAPDWHVGIRVGLHMAGLRAEWEKVNGVKKVATSRKRRESGG